MAELYITIGRQLGSGGREIGKKGALLYTLLHVNMNNIHIDMQKEAKAPSSQSSAPGEKEAADYGGMTIDELKPLLQTVNEGKLTMVTIFFVVRCFMFMHSFSSWGYA